jgi:hypothetical protein
MPIYQVACEFCGKAFTATRSKSQAPPRFCSQKCNGAARGNPMVGHDVECANCGVRFTAKRIAVAPPPRYCSTQCYSASGRSTRNVLRNPAPARRRSVTRMIDGRPVSTTRARWVWNETHPDDPVGPDDHIHHIDGDRWNDDPSNLQKVTTGEHRHLHSRLPPDRVARMSNVMRAYHAANPGKQRKGSPRTCPVCGAEFYRPPSAKGETCSYACMGKLRSMRSTNT